MILLDRVSKSYGRSLAPALKNVSLNIKSNEFVILVGSSGAGKSTILKLLTLEEYPTSGSIIVGGIDYDQIRRRDIPRLRRRIGVIFQDFKLLSDKTVYENIAFALLITGALKRDINNIVPRVLKIVNLQSKADCTPSELSGGEAQRVAVARSLVSQPKILIADEPTGNLDPKHAWDVIDLLLKINNFGTTVILATHNYEIVKRLKKRLIVLEAGRIIKS